MFNAMMVQGQTITTKQLNAILPFLDTFRKMGFKCGEWTTASESTAIPHFAFTNDFESFLQTLYDNEWIEELDWIKWQETAAQYVESPDLLATANTETIRTLLTTHVRKDYFCEGHLAAMFENGHIEAILQRLKGIRNEASP